MRSGMKTFVLILALVSVAAAADKPNFSGDWKVNIAKSHFGPYPTPSSLVRKITHEEPTLTVVEENVGGFGEERSTRTYTLGGKATVYQAMNAEITSLPAWDGEAIVINAQGIASTPAGAITFEVTERWTLSDGGKTLRQGIHVDTPQGPLDLTYVFDRQ